MSTVKSETCGETRLQQDKQYDPYDQEYLNLQQAQLLLIHSKICKTKKKKHVEHTGLTQRIFANARRHYWEM